MVSPAAPKPLSPIDIPEPHNLSSPDTGCALRRSDQNVGPVERVASILLGSLLLANGIKRMSLFGFGLAGLGAGLIQRGATGRCPMYSALNVTGGQSLATKTFSNPLHQQIRVEESIIIHKPVEEIYRFWRNLENLPSFMDHLLAVHPIDQKRSHWIARAPAGRTVEWDADIVAEQENHRLAWRSVQGGGVASAGQVLFEKDGDNTRIHVILTYAPPAGIVGAAVARLFGEEPAQSIAADLHHLKHLMESSDSAVTGESPT